MSKAVIRESEIYVNIKNVLRRATLNFTDIVANNNKMYNLEVVESTDGKFFIYTNYGRVGGTLAKEYRKCIDQSDAEREADKIIKSKLKKGYVEVKLIQATVGSELGRSKIEASQVSLEEAKKMGFKIQDETKSALHPAVQAVVRTWFGSIEQFVINTLDTSKCALGQLSLAQINKGRDLLLEARKIVAAGTRDISSLNNISSKYYSNIPMNFGYNKLDAATLRFDTNDKLDAAFEVLDTLEGAKDVEKVLSRRSDVDEKYKTLKTEVDWLDPKDPIWIWLHALFLETKTNNRNNMGNLRISNIFKLGRPNERQQFMTTADRFCSTSQKRVELPSALKPIWHKRPTEEKSYETILEQCNVLQLMHGTRTQNIGKILPTFLKLPRAGFTISGSMYGNGVYFALQGAKACGYTSISNSFYGGGSDKKAYVFVSDVLLGKQKIANGSYQYSLRNIEPCKSVWAKGGSGGVINDEFIVYTEQQNWLRYIIEFETQAR